MKNIINILALSLFCLQGCEKDSPGGIAYGPGPRSFAPRDVNYMWMVAQSTSYQSSSYLSISIVTHNQLLDEKSWPDCYISTWMNVDAPIAEVEERSRERHERFSYIRIMPIDEYVIYLEEYPGKHPGIQFDGPLYPKLIEYRTEGIADLKITADRSLSDKAPGECLNDHFAVSLVMTDIDHIRDFRYDDFTEIRFPWAEHLGESRNLIELDTWLSHKPMLREGFGIMTIEPFLGEGEEPVTITVELTTTKGKRFISTQQAQTTLFEGGLRGEHIYREEFLATRLDE